jgi:hypothetical protein
VLTPNQNQLDQMGSSMLCDDILQVLIDSYPDKAAVFSSSAAKTVVLEQMKKADGYGIESELDIGRYVITAWLMGRDFDTKYPTMNSILVSATATATQKMDAIEQIAEAVFDTLSNDE